MQTKQKQKIIGAVTLLVLLFFFLPQHFAHAIWPLPDANDLMAYFFTSVFKIIADVIGVTSAALNYAVSVRAGGDIPVVATTWKILRDFSNMIFIILLIYMAFATIFDHGKYTFKEMIVRFVIVAVLINFSMVIGLLIIDAVQVLTNIFLGSIGNIGVRLGQYLSPGELLPAAGKTIGAADLAGGGLVSLLFAVILSSILLFSMLVALVFALVRVPIIWALLIVSPIAWMSHILPNSEQWWKKWWNLFFGWNLFLPVYLFFIYIGLLFLSKRNEIISSVIQVGTTANPANDPLVNTLTNGLTFNLLFFYVFAAMVMVGGTWAATKVTSMMGGGFEKGLGWAKGLVKSVPLPYVGNLQAGGKAFGDRYGKFDAKGNFIGGQFQQEGFKQGGFVNKWTGGAANKIYGGKDAQTRAEAKAGSVFGVNGAEFKNQKDFIKNAGESFQKIEDEYDTGKLTVDQLRTKVQSTKATTAEGYAYRKLAIKKGALVDDKQFTDALASAEKNPYAIQDLIKTAKDAKFAGIKDLKAIAFDPRLNHPNFTPVKRELLLSIAGDSKKAAKLDTSDVAKAVTILGGDSSPEAKKFLKDVGDIRPDLIAMRKSATSGRSNIREMYKLVYNTEAKKLADMPVETWRDPAFVSAIKMKIARLNKTSKPLPEGDMFMAGTALPHGTGPGIPLPNGSILVSGRPGTHRGPGVSKFKGRLGGGDKFKTQLDNATSANITKGRIVASL